MLSHKQIRAVTLKKKGCEDMYTVNKKVYPQGRIDLNNKRFSRCKNYHIHEHFEDASFFMMKGKLNAKANT